MNEAKKKLLVIHQYLAPYRIDLWNGLNKLFDLNLFFIHANVLEQKFDQRLLRSMLHFEPNLLLTGFNLKKRAFRFIRFSFIKKRKPDIIFTYEYSQITIFTAIYKKFINKKYKHYTICDDSLDIAEKCSGLRRIARNFTIRHLDGIIVINEAVANWYNHNFKLENECFVLPIIHDDSEFKKKLNNALELSKIFIKKHQLEGKKIFFYVGRLETIKGVHQALAAFQKISSSEEAIFIIIGEGSQKHFLQDFSNQLNIQSKVIFLGKLVGDELYAWYNIGQIFILASSYEPFGAVVAEALQAGARVLCSSLAGSSGLINMSNGCLFDPADVEMLSRLMAVEMDNTESIKITDNPRKSKLGISLEDRIQLLFERLN